MAEARLPRWRWMLDSLPFYTGEGKGMLDKRLDHFARFRYLTAETPPP
jgi:hypothetical protein